MKYANYHTTLHGFEQECENRGLAPHFLKELEFLEKNYPLQNNENFVSGKKKNKELYLKIEIII